MLQEAFLALSGHPSSLFDGQSSDFPYITPAESALLESMRHLAELHRVLRERLDVVSRTHTSLICRAVATSIRSTHLARFQSDIVDVERGVLVNDPANVGAYEIVPLASVVAHFEPWTRRLKWYQEVSSFMSPASSSGKVKDGVTKLDGVECNGIQLVNKLRRAVQTGFRDIEIVATELTTIAERSWIRLLVQGLATGQASSIGSQDFFIHPQKLSTDATAMELIVVRQLIPDFVTEGSASSIFFLCKTVKMLQSASSQAHLLRTDKRNHSRSATSMPSTLITTPLLQDLMTMPYPITSSRLSRIIEDMRSSIARDIVREVLPIDQFLRVLIRLRQFMLVGRGDFVDALILQADDYVATRHRQLQTGSGFNAGINLAGIMMKEGDVKGMLSRTYAAMAPFISKDQLADEGLDWAREHLTLAIAKSRPSTEANSDLDNRFADLLLLNPVELSFRLDPAYDLFFSQTDLATYATINSYLLAIRRGHNHLSDLWRISQLRRDLPAPIRPHRVKEDRAFTGLKQRRIAFVSQMRQLQKVWINATATVSLLAELGTYLSGEVIEGSWRAFRRWAVQDESGQDVAEVDNFRASASSIKGTDLPELPHDPEILSQGHRQYLAALAEMLLLSSMKYTKALRVLLGHIDHLVALMHRLHTAQRNANLQAQGVYEGSTQNYGREVTAIHGQLDEASEMLRSGCQSVIQQLRRSSSERTRSRAVHADTGFQPFTNIAGVDRLLVRLDSRIETKAG